ncbi:MAG: hypothetical protein HXX18_04015 [Bacteroidetes bacterium]|nr:hypothetical protein [Bacteroidota bacterium]
MKTIKIISIAIIITMISGFTTFAKDNSKIAQKNELKSILSKKVQYPSFASENLKEGTVLVQFTVNEEGKIVIKEMNYLDVELGEYVKECLGKVVVGKDDISVGKTQAIKFDFKLL